MTDRKDAVQIHRAILSTTICNEIAPLPAMVTENIWSWSRGDSSERAWRGISAPCPELNQGALDEKQDCQPWDRRWPECRSKVTLGRSLVWTQEYFKEARSINTYRSPLLLTQRNISESIEKCRVFKREAAQRQRTERSVCVLRRSPGRGDVNPSFRTVLLGLWSPLSNYLVSFFTPDWSLHPPQDVGMTFAKIDPPQRPVGACPHLLWDGAPSLFGHQGGFLPLYSEVFFNLRSGHRISLLPQTSASATRFALGVCEWEQSFNFTPDKYQLSSPEAPLSPMSNPAERHEPQKPLLGGWRAKVCLL